jgi:hypothetical protein
MSIRRAGMIDRTVVAIFILVLQLKIVEAQEVVVPPSEIRGSFESTEL